jgi:hypothetical protein
MITPRLIWPRDREPTLANQLIHDENGVDAKLRNGGAGCEPSNGLEAPKRALLHESASPWTASLTWKIGNVDIRFIANRPAFSVKIVDSAE